MLNELEMVQYTVVLKNAPGQLHAVVDALAGRRINLLGLTVETLGDIGYVRFVAERDEEVRRTLDDLGDSAFETEAFCILVPNRAGELARLTKMLEEEDVNVATAYATAGDGELSRVVLTVDRPEKARVLLAAFAENIPAAAR